MRHRRYCSGRRRDIGMSLWMKRGTSRRWSCECARLMPPMPGFPIIDAPHTGHRPSLRYIRADQGRLPQRRRPALPQRVRLPVRLAGRPTRGVGGVRQTPSPSCARSRTCSVTPSANSPPGHDAGGGAGRPPASPARSAAAGGELHRPLPFSSSIPSWTVPRHWRRRSPPSSGSASLTAGSRWPGTARSSTRSGAA